MKTLNIASILIIVSFAFSSSSAYETPSFVFLKFRNTDSLFVNDSSAYNAQQPKSSIDGIRLSELLKRNADKAELYIKPKTKKIKHSPKDTISYDFSLSFGFVKSDDTGSVRTYYRSIHFGTIFMNNSFPIPLNLSYSSEVAQNPAVHQLDLSSGMIAPLGPSGLWLSILVGVSAGSVKSKSSTPGVYEIKSFFKPILIVEAEAKIIEFGDAYASGIPFHKWALGVKFTGAYNGISNPWGFVVCLHHAL